MKNNTVLILSDKPKSLLSWMEAFEQRGLEAIPTSSIARVMQHWQKDAPILTIVDLSLPFADCLKICRQLRDIASAPLLLVLPSPNGDDILAAYRAGVNECLIQPASPAVLLLKALAWSMRSGWAFAEPVPSRVQSRPANMNRFTDAMA